ncbi:hypothetical protein [Vibrio diabolicus]|uniref:hypothetical protein n=1 Tax=Vibrio diabolicus TaxID=50719 RepID=UPI003750A492
MTSNKKLLTGSALALGAVLAIFLINSNNKNSQSDSVASFDEQIKTEDAATMNVTPPESDAAQEVVTVPTPQNNNDASSDVISATPWISAPLNELSNELYDFIGKRPMNTRALFYVWEKFQGRSESISGSGLANSFMHLTM